jgi:hypothetical protein
MTTPLEELKLRARLRQKAAQGAGAALALKDGLALVARGRGFLHFEQARRVLGGLAARGDDMGSFWHAPLCSALLSEWFARYAEAHAAWAAKPGAFLLPYRRQFMVVGEDFVRELGLDPADAAWAGAGRDLVGGYGSLAWQALALQRLRAPDEAFASKA